MKQEKNRIAAALLAAVMLLAQPLAASAADRAEPAAAEIEAVVAAGSETDGEGSGASLPVPRYVSLKVKEVNARSGPGLRYPIEWVYNRQGLPVEIIREFDVWREIRDNEGESGWVHQSLLSGTRSVLVVDQIRTLRRKPDAGAQPVARLEPGVLALLEGCEGGWCKVSVASYDGWLQRNEIWGVYPDEIID